MDYRKEITELCDDYLPYITDIGLKYVICEKDSEIIIAIIKPTSNKNSNFTLYHWLDISNDILSFYTMLNIKFDIETFVFIENLSKITNIETLLATTDNVKIGYIKFSINKSSFL